MLTHRLTCVKQTKLTYTSDEIKRLNLKIYNNYFKFYFTRSVRPKGSKNNLK